jgi:phospholipid/cholesterol/gamma-HCH transport system substrate-binding protein
MSSISDSLAKLNVSETMANLNATLASFDELMRKANEGEGSLGMLLNDEELYVNLNNTNQQLQLLLEDMRLNPQRYVRFSIFGNNKPYEEPKSEE